MSLSDEIKKEYKEEMKRANQWWKTASLQERKLVWDEIQRQHADPVLEVTSRFAQLGYYLIVLANDPGSSNEQTPFKPSQN